MKKFYSLLSVVALTAFAANAQGLGTATLESPSDQYITSVPEIIVQWMNNGEATPIQLAGGKTSFDVTVNVAGTSATAQATLYSGNGQTTDSTNGESVGIQIQIPEEAPFYKEEPGIFMPMYVLTTGNWTVTIPAGSVEALEGSATNDADQVSFTVYGRTGVDPLTVPELSQYAMVGDVATASPEELESLSFSWVGYTIEKVLGTITIIAQEEDNEGWGYGDAEGQQPQNLPYTLSADKSELLFNLSEYPEGVYKISFSEQCLLFNDNVIWSGYALDYYVNIFNGMTGGKVIYPEASNGSTFSNIIFSWGKNITFAGNSQMVTVTTPEGDKEEVKATLAFVQDEEGDHTPSTGVSLLADDPEVYNALVVDVFEIIQEYGNGSYGITIPEGIVVSDPENLPNSGMLYDFRVQPLAEELAEITINDENNIEITYAGWDYVDSTESGYIVVKDQEGEIVATQGLYFMPTMDGDYYATVYVSNYKDGNYELVIPEASIILMDESYNTYFNAEQTFYFTVDAGEVSESDWSGIEKLEVVKAEVKGVYNLQGVKVANDAQGLGQLPKGLYIINGKKVLVK